MVIAPNPSVPHSPRRERPPGLEIVRGPLGRFVRMAHVAGVRNLQGVGGRRRNETECVATDAHVGNRLFDTRHVASNALISG
jgi:hypothetical protein